MTAPKKFRDLTDRVLISEADGVGKLAKGIQKWTGIEMPKDWFLSTSFKIDKRYFPNAQGKSREQAISDFERHIQMLKSVEDRGNFLIYRGGSVPYIKNPGNQQPHIQKKYMNSPDDLVTKDGKALVFDTKEYDQNVVPTNVVTLWQSLMDLIREAIVEGTVRGSGATPKEIIERELVGEIEHKRRREIGKGLETTNRTLQQKAQTMQQVVGLHNILMIPAFVNPGVVLYLTIEQWERILSGGKLAAFSRAFTKNMWGALQNIPTTPGGGTAK